MSTPRGERHHRIITLPVKGGSTHPVILAAYAGEILDAYLTERGNMPGPVFLTRTGAPLQRTFVYQLVQRIAMSAGILNPDTLSIHSIRHSVATAMLGTGEPLEAVQALLGHASPNTTHAYDRADQLHYSCAYRFDQRMATEVTCRQHRLVDQLRSPSCPS
ncbi:tyrosine-type recombinase/integrase [Streptosporangium amethystogenes]|uniref:tyrosine-type recombinase/integrase n=1 Tax=Streptosporangium amethystogenes TaxID=2002 RepID=UPI0004C4B26C|nr:tyrosine-type recombinase/integrase [Streptosporangium amethystogenes]